MVATHGRVKRHYGFAVAGVAGLTLLLQLGLPGWLGYEPWPWFASYLVSVNLATWFFVFYDKKIAGTGRFRVPEGLLFALAIAGGLPLAIMAMYLHRHKTRKANFKWTLFGCVFLTYGIAGALYWYLSG